MEVQLIAFTQPFVKMDRTGITNPIAIAEEAASVCYNSKPTKKYRIAKSCMASGHMSVMEHVAFTFHVKGISRACLAQLSRHRHISLSVRSQRYCREDDFNYVNPFPYDSDWGKDIYEAVAIANENYKDLVEDGMKPEDARMVLPNACCTELYLTANARSLIEMSHLRLCTRAQREIRELFQSIKECVAEVSPEIAVKMVPACEKHEGYAFCTEHDGCGKHPSLDEVYMKEADPDYPCSCCTDAEHCDHWDAGVCPTLNAYLGIDDFDPMDV